MEDLSSLRQHVINLLTKAEAHVDVATELKGFPAKLRGRKPDGAPHTPWQLLEHMRIAQWDILKFSVDASHVSPKLAGRTLAGNRDAGEPKNLAKERPTVS